MTCFDSNATWRPIICRQGLKEIQTRLAPYFFPRRDCWKTASNYTWRPVSSRFFKISSAENIVTMWRFLWWCLWRRDEVTTCFAKSMRADGSKPAPERSSRISDRNDQELALSLKLLASVGPNFPDNGSTSESEEPSVESGIREIQIWKEEKRKWTDGQSNQGIGFGRFGLGNAANQQKDLDQCHFSWSSPQIVWKPNQSANLKPF